MAKSVGNLTGSAEQYASAALGDRTLAMDYDSINRLVLEQSETTEGPAVTTYKYDAGNNRVAKSVP